MPEYIRNYSYKLIVNLIGGKVGLLVSNIAKIASLLKALFKGF
jgi:hypothetical protein